MTDPYQGRRATFRAAGLVATILLVPAPLPAFAQAGADRVFTVGNFPLEARSTDAVEAKKKAIAEGQQAAFRSLLKRIVPVTAYSRIGKLKAVNAADLVDGVSVRSERNSQTEYIATYDIAFQAEAVRRLLDKQSIPFLDRQAPPVMLIPVYIAPKEPGTPELFEDARGSDTWLYAWRGLDVSNSLTPIQLKTLKREVHADTLKALAGGQASAVRALTTEYKTDTIVVAILEPNLDQKKVQVALAGRDAVANFHLNRTYRLDGPDLAYTAELAAVISLGVLEGRWKAINVRRGVGAVARAEASPAARPAPLPISRPEPAPAGPAGGSDGQLRISVEFRDMAEWQRISRQLSAIPDVSDLDVEGLSGRGARISLRYPRSAQDLALTLAQSGLIMRNTGSGWILQPR